jgi:hypothetical protein
MELYLHSPMRLHGVVLSKYQRQLYLFTFTCVKLFLFAKDKRKKINERKIERKEKEKRMREIGRKNLSNILYRGKGNCIIVILSTQAV